MENKICGHIYGRFIKNCEYFVDKIICIIIWVTPASATRSFRKKSQLPRTSSLSQFVLVRSDRCVYIHC